MPYSRVVRDFYEKNPFPNYGDDNLTTLHGKAENTLFEFLNNQIPPNIKILEVGCGTGQLSNYLGIANRWVYGTDICSSSLKLAEEFRRKYSLNQVQFLYMDLFEPIFRQNSFPIVICNGVLHHTYNPFKGFEVISKLVKKRGYIVIGLYNRYGRASNRIRRLLFKISDKFRFLDKKLKEDTLQSRAWFQDQYNHPHELTHTINEVLGWFKKTGFEFVNIFPNFKSSTIFKPSSVNWIEAFIIQTFLMFRPKEGGFFTMVGRKR